MINNLLNVLKTLEDTLVIFTGVNPDINSDLILTKINKFKKYKNFKFYKHLGQSLYLSLAQQVDCVVGNSSSGFIELPFLKVPVVNIGERQNGRPISNNIIQTSYEKKNIQKAIKKIYSLSFRKNLKYTKSFYFKKNTTRQILKILKNINLNNIKIKKFNINENI